MIIIIGLSFVLLFSVNSIMEYIDSAFSAAYEDNLTGQASISPAVDGSFTLFGSDNLLVGEYLVPPLFEDYTALETVLADNSDYLKLPLLTGAAQMSVRGRKQNKFLFGVNFTDYQKFFPDIKLVSGSFPAEGEPGILIQQDVYDYHLSKTDQETLIGEPVLLTTAYESSFTIREVPLAGVFQYPVTDNLLERVVLVDADTVRSLNGYVYGASETVELNDEEKDLLDSSLDALFGNPVMDDDTKDSESKSTDEDTTGLLASLEGLFSTPEESSNYIKPKSDAWNFVLFRGEDEQNVSTLVSQLQQDIQYTDIVNTIDVRDWRRTIGGNVIVVWFIRILLNIGILFVLFGAVSVAMNAIVLSVLERKKEIGTMRAIGAAKLKVGMLIGYEVIFIILGSAILGVVIGILFVRFLNFMEVTIDNSYIQLLLGGSAIHGVLSFESIAFHLLGAFGVSILSLLYPLKKILQLSPVKAMQ